MIDPAMAARLRLTYLLGTNMTYYRFTLPLQLGTKDVHSGNWNAVLEIQEHIFKRYLSNLGNDKIAFDRAISHGIRYSLNIQAYSNLKLKAYLIQDNLEPGVILTIRAVLTESGLPLNGCAKVKIHLARPDKTMTLLSLDEIEPGIFENDTTAAMSGIYVFQLAAVGISMRGLAFTRELTLTAAVIGQGNDSNIDMNEQNHQSRNIAKN